MTDHIAPNAACSVSPGSARGRGALLVGSVVAYLAVQMLFFPSYYSSADEGCYVAMAFTFASGHVSSDGRDLNLYRFDEVSGRRVGGHDAGFSFLMVPLTFLGDRALFSFNILLHLIGFVVFWLLLRRLGIHPAFSLLYLLHPTLWYFSRNIANDLPSTALLVCGLSCFLLNGAWVLAAGVLWALSIFVRPATSVFLVPLVAAWLVAAALHGRRPDCPPEYRRPWKKLALLAVGSAPLLAILLVYNVTVLHSVMGLSPTRRFLFSTAYLWRNLVHYAIRLDVLYPLMLVVFFFYRGRLRWPVLASVVLGGFFYVLHPDIGELEGFGTLTGMVLGLRFLQPVLPLLLLAYAGCLDGIASRLPRVFWTLFALGGVILFAGDVAISVHHQRFMDRCAWFRDELFDHTPKGALVVLDYPAHRFIAGAVTRPRELVCPFLYPNVSPVSREELDGMVLRRGGAWVAELHPGGNAEAHERAQKDLEEFVGAFPHRTTLDVRHGPWRLLIRKLEPAPPPAGP